MALRILRSGSTGNDVSRWQNFLLGQRCYRGEVDGDFGELTANATKTFQRAQGLSADGIVGPKTIARALTLGFDIGFTDPNRADHDEALLPGAAPLKPLTSTEARQKLFGRFQFEPAPVSNNREAIRILGDWQAQNIVMVPIPQLKGISTYGKPNSGRMQFHRAAAEQLKALWASWESAGLLDRILTFEGAFSPRFIRGSRSDLSNHAFGSAFDINAKWNPLGAIPASAGSEGSVRELVEIANAHGFYWGGHFATRPDGMHFEVAKLM